ncbi:hypothetical protein BYT27DRAFT_6532926 [Phlegmacium glaucopus]|nr:hypothetical protein BYT27DRAFT_6532926 [Phlegmacium glaucopus]
MSAFTRLLHLPASRRTYSSFFSSKSGGGRYFNSAKPPKNTTVALKNNTNVDSPEVQKDGVQAGSASQNTGASQNPITDAQSSQTASGSASVDESSKTATPQTTELSNALAELSNSLMPHLIITPKDFKTHQFFSLHRPLLLISQPTSIFRPIPPNHSIFEPIQSPVPQNPFGFDPASEPSVDADAEAARQLTRALTMNKAGATISWENTLKHLGLDVAQEADRVNLQQQFDKEWQEVMMDSTKRKRRKKMKKHK